MSQIFHSILLHNSFWETEIFMPLSRSLGNKLLCRCVISYFQASNVGNSHWLLTINGYFPKYCLKGASTGTNKSFSFLLKIFISRNSPPYSSHLHLVFIISCLMSTTQAIYHYHSSLAALIRCLQQIRISFHHVVAKFYGIWPSCSDAGTGY